VSNLQSGHLRGRSPVLKRKVREREGRRTEDALCPHVGLYVGALDVLVGATVERTAMHPDAKGERGLTREGLDALSLLVLVVEKHVAGQVIAATDDSATLGTRPVADVCDLQRGERDTTRGHVTCLEGFADDLARHWGREEGCGKEGGEEGRTRGSHFKGNGVRWTGGGSCLRDCFGRRFAFIPSLGRSLFPYTATLVAWRGFALAIPAFHFQ
jgi:hypothetical protein